MVLGGISGPLTIMLISLIHKSISQQIDATAQHVIHPGLWFAAACTAVLVTQVASKCILVRLSQATSARLQFELCIRILAAPLAKLEAIGSPRLLNSLRGDVNAITGALANFPTVCASVMVLVSGIGYLACLSAPLALFTVVLAVMAVASYMAGIHWANQYMYKARAQQDNIAALWHSFVDGLKELKGNNSRTLAFVYDVLLPADTSMRKRMIKGMDILSGAHSWGRLSLFVGIGLMVFVWPNYAAADAVTLMGYTLTILYLTSPLDSILAWLPAMNGASIAMSRVHSLGLLIDPSDTPPIDAEPPAVQTIELQDVCYRYPSENPSEKSFQLGPLNLTVHAGEILFIAGGNGSGKTTLVKLLTGLYQPDNGRVLLNGKTVNAQTVGNYRQLFATVFVEGHLFDRLMGDDINPMQLAYWMNLLEMQGKVNPQTGRLSLGQLSRGQHKRLALLVACLDDRQIFVFDEWAAEQDPGFKEVFYRRILPELKARNRTVVAITHDDRYFTAADRVVKFTDGVIEAPSSRAAA